MPISAHTFILGTAVTLTNNNKIMLNVNRILFIDFLSCDPVLTHLRPCRHHIYDSLVLIFRINDFQRYFQIAEQIRISMKHVSVLRATK